MISDNIDLNKLDIIKYAQDTNEYSNTYKLKLIYNNNDLVVKSNEMKIYNLQYNELDFNNISCQFIKTNNLFYNFIQKLNTVVIKLLCEKSMALLGVQFKYNNLIDLYKNCIEIPKNVYECPIINLICEKNICANLCNDSNVDVDVLFDTIIIDKNKCFMECKIKNINLITNTQIQQIQQTILFENTDYCDNDIINFVENDLV
jgi:hypothetical protein